MVGDGIFGGLRWLEVGSVGLLQGWDGGMAGVEGCGMAGGMARRVRWLEVGSVRSVWAGVRGEMVEGWLEFGGVDWCEGRGLM